MSTQTQTRKTTVLIGGSGLTGLSLALMLQHLGIPYLLLEAYGSCTPNVGASIAVQPNGLRIYDQLGILKDIQAVYQPVKQMLSVDAETGKLHDLGIAPILKERHGYETGFFNRYDLLCVLHKNIREKDRLLVNQKIVRVDNFKDRVVVQTKAGDVFEAQMLIGADGVRSTVRKEMWRDAEESGAEIPKEDKKEIICDWATCFGVSDYGSHLPRGQAGSVAGQDFTAGWMVGKDGRCFTFWFYKLPQETRMVDHDNIPRFSEEEHERQIARAKKILAQVPRDKGLNVDFDKLYDQRDPVHSGVTALPHFCLKKWHHGRTVVIGDSSHKFNPLPGHGGMNCVVSAATLINCLQEALGDNLQTSNVWDAAPLEEAFTKLAETRYKTVTEAVGLSEKAMWTMGWGTTFSKLMYKVLVPTLPSSMQCADATKVIKTGVALQKNWDAPNVPKHSVLFDDEEKLQKRTSSGALSPAALVFAATAAIGGIMALRATREHPELLASGWKTLQSVVA
ncbi:hypothetical protein KVR01_012418 [Diaporthe batatas]|uniref:uncharacterized protein n=1 Tax=Diaporthe batatas TaxID=748121 RepID=UPI001D041A92|nr:uncharacterized protein KVR01_012418 [Diaporthe batatas]KAG8157756.1 hypothetical protein KVR01_012418 [Diaporthe batatas]